MDLDWARHFVEFLLSSNLIQNVAYGTSFITFSDGSKQLLPKSVLKSPKSYTINEYNKYCKSFSFKLLSNNTLWQILKALKPGAQQAMAGLDNVTADALQGFKTIENITTIILDDLNKINDLKKKLENGKIYLKLSFGLHCSDDTVNTHCISHALYNSSKFC